MLADNGCAATTARLKILEPEVPAEDPWRDDALGRAEVAGRLTNLIEGMREPFVISIDGSWGTGKTFLLKRWHRDLENKGFRAIYFNAWEDDFCDDPFLAMFGQLSEHFKGRPFADIIRDVLRIAEPLIWANLSGVLNMTTGLPPLAAPPEGREGPLRFLDRSGSVLKEYQLRTAAKNQLKESLERLSSKVKKETDRPLVFIIDELDRCRPTFAIELLERVKHLFDVPNLVFAFGINRKELCAALESVYGEIEASVYLRRFFDMEFLLPEPDTVQFGKGLMARYGLDAAFDTAFEYADPSSVEQQERLAYFRMKEGILGLWHRLGLSLRDVDQCVRVLALLSRNRTPHFATSPLLAGVLATLRLKNPGLYKQMAHGDYSAGSVMNYINSEVKVDGFDGDTELMEQVLDDLEVSLYVVHRESWGQLVELCETGDPGSPSLLPTTTLEEGKSRACEMLQQVQGGVRGRGLYAVPAPGGKAVLDSLLKSIDLCGGMVPEC